MSLGIHSELPLQQTASTCDKIDFGKHCPRTSSIQTVRTANFETMSDNESSPSRVSSLPIKLSDKVKYRRWRFEVEVPLKYYRALDIVKGTATEPMHPGSRPSTDVTDFNTSLKWYKKAHRKWENRNDLPIFFLLHNISEEVKDVIPQHSNPAILWKALEVQFDLQTMATLCITFANLTSLQYSPETSLKDNLTIFVIIWRMVV